MGDWDQGLLGCFGNIGVCAIVYFLPCIAYGQIMEKADITGCFLGVVLFFVPVLDLFCLAKARSAAREKSDIEGSFIMDLVLSYFFPCCVMTQTQNQLDVGKAMGQDIERV